MTKRGAGVSFMAVAAFIYVSKYITAAIYSIGLEGWSNSIFSGMLRDIGYTLNLLALISLIIGIIYLVAAEKKNDVPNKLKEKSN